MVGHSIFADLNEGTEPGIPEPCMEAE